MPFDTESVQSEDIYFDYEPSFECVIDDVEDPIPMPPPPSSRRRSFLKSQKMKQVPDPLIGGPRIVVTGSACDEEIEVQTTATWSNVDHYSSRRSRKFLFTAIACLLVAATMVLLILGVRKAQDEDIDTGGNFASVNEDGTVGSTDPPLDSKTTPSPIRLPTSAPIDKDSPATSSPINNPTPAPIDSPDTSAPTTSANMPTNIETLCTTFVSADQDCYPTEKTIHISFENCDPFEDDWIGIYPNKGGVDLNDLGDPSMWIWACGTSDCRGKVFVDTIPFGGDFKVGPYVAHLVRRNSGGPYASYSASDPFTVATECL